MDVGASVSRVGSAAQTKAMKAVSKTIKGDISRYNEVKAFAQFGTSDLDQGTRNLLNRGEKLMEVLKQGQYLPMSLEREVIALVAVDYVLDLPTEDVRRFEEELLQFIEANHGEVLQQIRDSQDLADDVKEQLGGIIEGYKENFQVSEQ